MRRRTLNIVNSRGVLSNNLVHGIFMLHGQ